MLNQVAGSLEKYMDVLSARQKLVASNIANVDTPGYHTKDVNFQSEFQSHLAGQNISNGSEVPGLSVKNDGNNVNIDREARLLAENSIRFSAASNLAKTELKALRTAIHEGAA